MSERNIRKKSKPSSAMRVVPTPLAFEVQQREVERERKDRIAKYKLEVKRAKLAGVKPLRIYADGDSWFDYPLPVLKPSDITKQLVGIGKPTPVILNLAHHGDESRTTLGVSKRQRIIDSLNNQGPFDAILFSGGGDDIAGDQFCLWVDEYQPGTSPADGLNIPRFRNVLGVVESAYMDLIEIRDAIAEDCTIFVHGYDFPWPDGRGVCTLGPWLRPSLTYRGWSRLQDGAQVVQTALCEFDHLLTSLETRYPDNLVYVRTQGTLTPPGEWANELHPTPAGFAKIARKFLMALRAKFPGRI